MPVRTGPRGIDPGHLMEQLVPLVRASQQEAGVGGIGTAVVGAAGFASLGDGLRAELPGALEREFGVRTVALVADAVTAYTGALGPRPGAVVAAGTGLVAIGTDLKSWRRADGWGHLLGDCGGGAWIGRAGLEAALRAHDGRPGARRRCWPGPRRRSDRCGSCRGGSIRGRTGPPYSPRSRPTWRPVPRATRWPGGSCARRPGT